MITPHAIVLGRFPPPLDGQTLATRRLAAMLSGEYDVHTFDLSPPSEYTVVDARFRWSRIRHYLGLRERLRSELERYPDAPVLWTSISPAPLGHARDVAVTTRAFGGTRPVFAVIHSGDFDRLFRHPLTRASSLRLARRINCFVFLDPILSASCAPWIPENGRTAIPNTIDAEVLCTPQEVRARQDYRKHPTPVRLLFLSNMIPEKGYLDALDAVRILRDMGMDAHLTLAGGWMSEASRIAFEQLLVTLGLQDAVRHHGPVSDRTRIKQLHLESDVFLLPTYYPTEAQPLAIIEALNAGTPIVTTRQGGIPEMVRDGKEALFVPPRSPQAIAEAIQSLTDSERWIRMSESARSRFEATFSPDIVRSQWMSLLARHAPCNLPPG